MITLCLLQEPWITFVEGESILTVEAFVVSDGQRAESHSVVLTAMGVAADEAANDSSVGKLISIEVDSPVPEWVERVSAVEQEYRDHYQMDADHKTLFAKSLKVLQLSEQVAA